MSTKQFIDIHGLSVYDELIKQVISEGDAKAIKAASLEGKRLNLYTQENPTAQDQPRFSITLPFTEEVILGTNGKAMIKNEEDGGGVFFEHKDNLKSFVGVNDGSAGEIAAQIYAINTTTKKGTRINVTTEGIYYTNGATSPAFTADDEIATKKDVRGDASSKTIYLKDESTQSSDYAKVYRIYQGSDSIDMSKNTLVGSINIPKDLFIKSGSIGTVVKDDEPYEGAKIGDKYIDLQLQNQVEHLYIPANGLVDIYTVAEGASEIQLAIDGNNVISASVVAINGSKLVDGSVTRTKLASDVTDSLDLADTALQSDDIDSVSEQDIRNLFN